jgi:hypothetical protein
MNDREYKRRRRRIEWMLTGHSKLRDRYAWRSRGLTLTVMGLSIVALLLALSNGDQEVSVLGLHGKLQVFLAWLAALTFFVTIVDLVVDWRRRAWAHANSAKRLGELSVLYGRALRDDAGAWSVDGVDLAIEYERVMGSLEPIPDNKAAAMKAAANRNEPGSQRRVNEFSPRGRGGHRAAQPCDEHLSDWRRAQTARRRCRLSVTRPPRGTISSGVPPSAPPARSFCSWCSRGLRPPPPRTARHDLGRP